MITAAIAEHYGAIVLHDDRGFDHIAAVTGQQTQWVVPAGTAD
ncbi:PIN domain nuclease [Allorhizocola rhizosphaerae]|nr:PIN domain nuclease [Allorhizocola rhizosphaerae]